MTEHTVVIRSLQYTAPRTISVMYTMAEVGISSGIDMPIELATIEEITRRIQGDLSRRLGDKGHVEFIRLAKELVGKEIKVDINVEDHDVA